MTQVVQNERRGEVGIGQPRDLLMELVCQVHVHEAPVRQSVVTVQTLTHLGPGDVFETRQLHSGCLIAGGLVGRLGFGLCQLEGEATKHRDESST